jgi:hypothetical protein
MMAMRTLFMGIVCVLAWHCAAEGMRRSSAQEMQPLKYHHPGLTVDLGVGLWAWPIPCDADGDGDFDLLVSCPDKPSNGVWMFENETGDTRNHPTPIFLAGKRISGTVPYVMPSYVDGTLRVLSPGKEYANFEREGIANATTLSIAPNFYQPRGTQTKGPKVRHNQWRYADYDGDGRMDVIVGIEDWSYYGWDDAWDREGRWLAGPLRGFVFWFRGLEDGNYAEPIQCMAGDVELETYGCPSPNFHDFDGDGDLDLLCGEFLDGFTYFQNVGTRTAPRYTTGVRLKNDRGEPLSMELQMIVPVAFDWDCDGDADLIVGDEDGRVAWVENTGGFSGDRLPVFRDPVYFQQQADTLKCGALATPVGVDWDGDGDQDILSGNTAGYLEFFENLSGPGIESPKWDRPKRLQVDGKTFRVMAGANGSIQGPAEAKWGYTTFSVADWDLDGRQDIVLNSILGEVVWLRNAGTPGTPRLERPQPIEVAWDDDMPKLAWGWRQPAGSELLTQWRTTPVVHDFNGDGLPDLAMLDTEGYLVFFPRERDGDRWVLQAPRRAFLDADGSPLRLNARAAGGSGRRKLCVVDWNGDGHFDWLLNSKNADLLLQSQDRDGQWIFTNAGSLSAKNIEGHDVSPTVVDFNGDQIPDFVGGAEDGRLYYLRNPRSNAP